MLIYKRPTHRFRTYKLVTNRAHFLLSSSFIEFQTVEFEHVTSSTFAQVFRVLAQVIRVFQVFASLSLAKFEILGLKLVEYLSYK